MLNSLFAICKQRRQSAHARSVKIMYSQPLVSCPKTRHAAPGIEEGRNMDELEGSFLILLLSLVPGSSFFGLMSFVTLGFTSTSFLLLLRLLNLSILV